MLSVKQYQNLQYPRIQISIKVGVPSRLHSMRAKLKSPRPPFQTIFDSSKLPANSNERKYRRPINTKTLQKKNQCLKKPHPERISNHKTRTTLKSMRTFCHTLFFFSKKWKYKKSSFFLPLKTGGWCGKINLLPHFHISSSPPQPEHIYTQCRSQTEHVWVPVCLCISGEKEEKLLLLLLTLVYGSAESTSFCIVSISHLV